MLLMKMHPIHHVVNFVNLEVFEMLFCVLLAGLLEWVSMQDYISALADTMNGPAKYLRGFPNFLSNDLPLIRLVFFDSLA